MYKAEGTCTPDYMLRYVFCIIFELLRQLNNFALFSLFSVPPYCFTEYTSRREQVANDVRFVLDQHMHT